jgi:hypothetical protein
LRAPESRRCASRRFQSLTNYCSDRTARADRLRLTFQDVICRLQIFGCFDGANGAKRCGFIETEAPIAFLRIFGLSRKGFAALAAWRLARTLGATATGVTLSSEQHAVPTSRCRKCLGGSLRTLSGCQRAFWRVCFTWNVRARSRCRLRRILGGRKVTAKRRERDDLTWSQLSTQCHQYPDRYIHFPKAQYPVSLSSLLFNRVGWPICDRYENLRLHYADPLSPRGNHGAVP